MPTRRAKAIWEGTLQAGKGRTETESGALTTGYSFGTRFGEERGSNPEELLAAAEAACYSMALAFALEGRGLRPERVETDAACTIERVGDGFRITRMDVRVRARVPGADPETFRQVAEETKTGCPVSRALQGNVELTLDAQLE